MSEFERPWVRQCCVERGRDGTFPCSTCRSSWARQPPAIRQSFTRLMERDGLGSLPWERVPYEPPDPERVARLTWLAEHLLTCLRAGVWPEDLDAVRLDLAERLDRPTLPTTLSLERLADLGQLAMAAIAERGQGNEPPAEQDETATDGPGTHEQTRAVERMVTEGPEAILTLIGEIHRLTRQDT